MKTYRAKAGPFTEQPYYKLEDIERICTAELQSVGLYPVKPGPVRIDRFVEKRFGVSPVYEEVGPGILGFTKFGPKGVEEIVISKGLAEEGTQVAERRINTTLAHEAGHGLLHAHLFALGMESRDLFSDGLDPHAPKILCRNDAVPGVGTFKQGGYDGRWWEYQANRAIGALLLPRPLLEAALDGILAVRGSFGKRVLERRNREAAARLAADVFEVNPIVAQIRLAEAYPEGDETQLTL
jgi:hypothetical protein